MRFDGKLSDIVQTAVVLSQTGDNVMAAVDAIEKRLRKGGVMIEVWLEDSSVIYKERAWALGFARFDGRYRLAIREVFEDKEPGYAMPLKQNPRLLRLRAATTIGDLLDEIHQKLQDYVEEATIAATAAEKALGDVENLLVDQSLSHEED